jgi:hypothetical protein
MNTLTQATQHSLGVHACMHDVSPYAVYCLTNNRIAQACKLVSHQTHCRRQCLQAPAAHQSIGMQQLPIDCGRPAAGCPFTHMHTTSMPQSTRNPGSTRELQSCHAWGCKCRRHASYFRRWHVLHPTQAGRESSRSCSWAAPPSSPDTTPKQCT